MIKCTIIVEVNWTMNVFVCVDDNMGTIFNHRRQSQDRMLRSRLISETSGSKLWVSQYTADQFSLSDQVFLMVASDFLDRAQTGDYCFCEGECLLRHEDRIESLILFKWNRVYPADTFFDIPLNDHGWKLIESCDFPGYSHDKITKETYRR